MHRAWIWLEVLIMIKYCMEAEPEVNGCQIVLETDEWVASTTLIDYPDRQRVLALPNLNNHRREVLGRFAPVIVGNSPAASTMNAIWGASVFAEQQQ